MDKPGRRTRTDPLTHLPSDPTSAETQRAVNLCSGQHTEHRVLSQLISTEQTRFTSQVKRRSGSGLNALLTGTVTVVTVKLMEDRN